MFELFSVTRESYIYRNPNPAARSRQATFPGIARLENGDLLAIFVIGEAFEAANCRPYRARSCDNGANWVFEGALFPEENQALTPDFSDCYKPTTLRDGSLIALGYGFFRDDPEKSLSDYITDSQHFPPSRNVLTRSGDQGKHWSKPEAIDTGLAGMEISGPAVQLTGGRLVCAGPEFSVDPEAQRGYILGSDDNGRSWRQLGSYFDRPGVTAWETRMTETEPGRLALILWAFDLKTNQHCHNCFCTSPDGGVTWSEPVDTGVAAQSSGLCYLGHDRLLTIHTHRSGDDIGLYVREVNIANGGFRILDCKPIWCQNSMKNADGSIDRQFANLNFGQPGIMQLGDDQFLAWCWCREDGMFVCKSYTLTIRF